MFVEALEDRRLFSVSPAAHVDHAAAMQMATVAHRVTTSVVLGAPLAPSYSGIYVLGDGSEGNADLEVLHQTKKGFSGTLTFTTGHGTEFSGNYHTTISNRLKFTFNFKSGNTNLKVTGSLQQIAVILCSLSGKFEGSKLPRVPGLNQMELIGLAFLP